MKISFRIFITIATTVLVPLIVLAILFNIGFEQFSASQNYAALSDLALTVGRQTEDYFKLKREAVLSASFNPVYAQSLASPGQATQAASEDLKLQLKALADGKDAFLLDAMGRVTASTRPERAGEAYVNAAVLEEIRKVGAYSSAILSGTDDKSYFFAAAPVALRGGNGGYLAVEFYTTFFSDLAKNSAVGASGYLFFVDASDRVFAHKYQERQTTAASFDRVNGFYQNFLTIKNSNPFAVGSMKTGRIDYAYNNDVNLRGAYYPLKDISGYLFVVRSLEELSGTQKSLSLTVNLLLLGLGLIAVLAAVFLTVSFKRPVFKILRSIDSLMKENGYIQCDYYANNELGVVAHELNRVNGEFSNAINDLREGEKRYRIALEAVSDIVWEYDVETQKYIFMAKDKGMLGSRRVENAEITACSWAYATDPEVEEQRDHDFNRFISGALRNYRAEYETLDIRGNPAWAESIATAIRNKDDKIVKVIGSITDITQKKLYDLKMLHSAEYDKLTSIYNRATIERRVKEELKLGGSSALMMIDLDNFKIINDTFGHQFGDQILQFVSSSICKVVTSKDLVGRIGGDEFIVFIKEVASEEALEEIAGKIVAALQSGYEKEGVTHRLSGSVGVAQAGAFGAVTYKELLACADFAMYSAKRRGKNKFCVFSEALHKEKVKNDAVAEHLKGLENSDILSLTLIPVFCNNNEKIVRFYADIDMHIPEYPDLTRDEIYKIAAESNRQANLLELTFRKVCRAIKTVAPYNDYNTAITYCIPVFTLQNEAVLAVLTRVAEEEQVDPKGLEIAIDPKTVGGFDRTSYSFITGLKRISSEIELMGFGGTYSSYNVVSDFHFDVVHFADDMVTKAVHSRKYLSILKSMMDIARQTATACTLSLSAAQRESLKGKLDICFTYSSGEHISFKEFCDIIKEKRDLTNKYDCTSYKSRLLENTIMGL